MRVHIGNETPFNPLAVKNGSPEFASLTKMAFVSHETPGEAFVGEVALALIHYYDAGGETAPADIAGLASIVDIVSVDALKRRADALRVIDSGDVWDSGATSLRQLMSRLIEARAAYLIRTTLH